MNKCPLRRSLNLVVVLSANNRLSCSNQGNLKRESVVVAILLSHIEVSC